MCLHHLRKPDARPMNVCGAVAAPDTIHESNPAPCFPNVVVSGVKHLQFWLWHDGPYLLAISLTYNTLHRPMHHSP